MKKILLSVLLIASTTAYSQELDEAYLQSLPDGVREDVLNKMSDKEATNEVVYKRPSSRVEKPIKLDKNGEEYVSDRFGMSIFDMMQSSFMPTNEPNLDSSYILDFGDTLELQLIGQKSIITILSVKRDGSVNIPDIGKIYISGLSLESATKLIKMKIDNAFIGTEAFVTLTNIRDIQVLIAGNAYNPGLYTLNGNSNILHALSMAGGMDENGSFREVELIRGKEVIHSIDLYDIFIYGVASYGPRLKTGDSLLIKPAKALVNINGGVNRPFVYEALENETFQDLINFANGFKYNVDEELILFERLEDNVITSNPLTISELNTTNPKSGDTLFVGEHNYRSVKVSGAVKIPGKYSFTDGETISDIISRAGGYKESAYPFGAVLLNSRARSVNEAAKEKLYNTFLETIVSNTLITESPSFPIILEQLRNTPVSGRVMAEFDLNMLLDKPSLDTNLEDGDELTIPYVTQQVYIYGQINNPGTTRYLAGKDISHYISSAGGATSNADRRNLFIIHPNGKTVSLKTNSKLSIFGSRANTVDIYPGSIIFIPRDTSFADPTKVASIWAPILSSLAVTITSLSVLDKN